MIDIVQLSPKPIPLYRYPLKTTSVYICFRYFWCCKYTAIVCSICKIGMAKLGISMIKVEYILNLHLLFMFDWWKQLLFLFSIDQSQRYGRPQAACREPAGSYDKTTRTAICFEHKTQYILIHAPYTRIVVFWHISNIPPMISQSQISCNTPTYNINICEILLYNRQLVVITHELIYGVRAAIR